MRRGRPSKVSAGYSKLLVNAVVAELVRQAAYMEGFTITNFLLRQVSGHPHYPVLLKVVSDLWGKRSIQSLLPSAPNPEKQEASKNLKKNVVLPEQKNLDEAPHFVVQRPWSLFWQTLGQPEPTPPSDVQVAACEEAFSFAEQVSTSERCSSEELFRTWVRAFLDDESDPELQTPRTLLMRLHRYASMRPLPPPV